MGRVIAQTTTENYWDGLTTVTEVLIVDVGGSSSAEALNKASGILAQRGWTVGISRIPESMYMKSVKWRDVVVMLYGADFYESDEGRDSQVEKLIKEVRPLAKPSALLVVEAYNNAE